METKELEKLAALARYYSLLSSTEAGSGHPTSSLSAADLMVGLMFGGAFRYDLEHPKYENNDRLIFSKGHASPLFYALWAIAGKLSEDELKTFRKIDSPLEGHPTLEFPYTEAATGSLGQGLSIGVGMAINAKYLDKLDYRTYVLLGDSEMAEGSVWEALALAAYYKLNNLVAFADINRLGQRGETMYGHDTDSYRKKAEAFGWNTLVIDGHNISDILSAINRATSETDRPTMIIAKTLKGKGVSFIEDQDNWHGKALKPDEFKKAAVELGDIDTSLTGKISMPEKNSAEVLKKVKVDNPVYKIGDTLATRKAYGEVLVSVAADDPRVVALDAETSNSTYAEDLKKAMPERFFEMFIAEQNMAGTALGLSRRGKIVFVSTFAAFLTRAFDQIRMSQYSDPNIKFVGSHAGVSIGEDGSSQMALEDIAMMRSVSGMTVFYPSDAVSTERLVALAAAHHGNVFIRTTRMATPILYGSNEQFEIGGSKVLKKSAGDVATVVAAGVTLHESLKAYEELQKEGINIRVIDLYSIKPLDRKTLLQAAKDTKKIITVEDHYPEGGIGEAVAAALSGQAEVVCLAVNKIPHSGKPEELLAMEEIDAAAIVKTVLSSQ